MCFDLTPWSAHPAEGFWPDTFIPRIGRPARGVIRIAVRRQVIQIRSARAAIRPIVPIAANESTDGAQTDFDEKSARLASFDRRRCRRRLVDLKSRRPRLGRPARGVKRRAERRQAIQRRSARAARRPKAPIAANESTDNDTPCLPASDCFNIGISDGKIRPRSVTNSVQISRFCFRSIFRSVIPRILIKRRTALDGRRAFPPISRPLP